MKKVIGATEVRSKFGSLLNRVYQGKEHLVVEKLGIPVAAVISIEEYERYRRLLAEAMLNDLGRQMGNKAAQKRLTEDRLLADMEGIRAEVYKEMYG